MSPTTPSSSASATEVAFLQHRVAQAGLLGAAISGGFLLFRVVLIVLTDQLSEIAHVSMLLHAAAAAAFLSSWGLNRSTTRSLRFVRTSEFIAFFVGCLFYEMMGYHIPIHARPELIVTLALTFAVVARAIYVPSTARRTFVLTASIGVPLLVVTFVMYLNEDLGRWATIDPGMASQSNLAVAVVATAFEAAWWTATTVICTFASRVIFGLRREVSSIRRLGQYALEERIGEGGMGVVYRASHAFLRRPTAIKLLPPDKMGAHTLARFEREVQLTAKLTHPNTITIYDYGRTPEGVFYYATELLDGATLMDVVDVGGPLPSARVVRILRDVAGALTEAHAAGVIHRDIKPANIMLCERGKIPDFVKVLDFGLVKDLAAPAGASLTHADAITGTPQYMSPEAITAPDSLDARSDLYALGAVGYFLLTGEHVFGGSTIVEVCSHHLHSQPIPPSERLGSALPSDLEQLILDCLAKDPSERPGSAAELQERLLALSDAEAWTAREARGWWEQHAPTLSKRRREAIQSVSEQTVAIDLAHRKTVEV